MNNKKIIVFVVFAALVGGIFGSLISSQSARADFFGDLYNQYLKPLTSPFSGSTVPSNQAQTQTQVYSPTVDYEQAVVKAIEQTSPAVISITISKNLPVIEQPTFAGHSRA